MMATNQKREDAVLLYHHLYGVCRFIESLTETTCTGTSDFFCHGVQLALLANKLAPDNAPVSKIYDITLARYEGAGNLPSFRHLDNINMFIDALEAVGIPKVFQPECKDVYECYRLPQLVYCLRVVQHMLGHPVIHFTNVPCNEETYLKLVDSMKGSKMPQFDSIQEVVHNFKTNRNHQVTRLTPMKPKKIHQYSSCGKENVSDIKKTGIKSLQKPTLKATFKSPREACSVSTSPFSTPSQIINRFNNSSSVMQEKKARPPLAPLNHGAESASNVQEWIRQQRQKKSSTNSYAEVNQKSFPSLVSGNVDEVIYGVYPIQDACPSVINEQEDDKQTKEIIKKLPDDYIPPPPSFSTGSSFPVDTCHPESHSYELTEQHEIESGPHINSRALRLSLSVPTSPFKATQEGGVQSNSAFSFDDLSVVVRNLADTKHCPSVSSLTVLDAQSLTGEEEACFHQNNNLEFNVDVSVEDSLQRLHSSLQEGSPSTTFTCLQALKAQYPLLPSLIPHAAPLYHVEMTEAVIDAKGFLSLEEICGGVMLVKAVTAVNTAVSAGSQHLLLTALMDPSTHLQDVNSQLIDEYMNQMQVALNQLAAVNAASDDDPLAVDTTLCPMLTYLHIQQIVDQVNTAEEDIMSQLGLHDQAEEEGPNTFVAAPSPFNSGSNLQTNSTPAPSYTPENKFDAPQNMISAGSCSSNQNQERIPSLNATGTVTAGRRLSRTLSNRLLQHSNSFSNDIFASLSDALCSTPPMESDEQQVSTVDHSSSLTVGESVVCRGLSSNGVSGDTTSVESGFSDQFSDVLPPSHKNLHNYSHLMKCFPYQTGMCSPLKPDEKYSQVSYERKINTSVTNEGTTPCSPVYQSHPNEVPQPLSTRQSRSSLMQQNLSTSFSIMMPNSSSNVQQPTRRRSRSQGEVERTSTTNCTDYEINPVGGMKRSNTADHIPRVKREHDYVNLLPQRDSNLAAVSYTVDPLYQSMNSFNQLVTPQRNPNSSLQAGNNEHIYSSPHLPTQSHPNDGSLYEAIGHSTPAAQSAGQVHLPPSTYQRTPIAAHYSNVPHPHRTLVNDAIYTVVQKKPKQSPVVHQDISRANISLQSINSHPNTPLYNSKRKQLSCANIARISSFYERGTANNYQRWIWEKAAIRIQQWWRIHSSLHVLEKYLNCLQQAKGANRDEFLSVLTPCLPLLPLTPNDLKTEKRLQIVKADLSRCLKSTAKFQQEVDNLDVQIGLLLTNTINIQERTLIPSCENELNPPFATVSCALEDGLDALACVGGTPTRKGILTPSRKGTPRKGTPKKETPSKKGTPSKGTPSKKYQTMDRKAAIVHSTGLKALRKCSRDRLKGYQHLFYLLQTDPKYLATLIFALPSAKTTRFVENVVFVLFNYGANDRDNFLLINLFKTALEEEIRCKVLRIGDIVAGDPLVVKMIISFVRKGPGRTALRDILGPLVTQVLEDTQLNLNTNPIEIYQAWLNEKEMQTGESSGYPYNITAEDALKNPEVVTRLNNNLSVLTRLTDMFCTVITQSIHKLPYALLYLAGVMRKALSKRFPHIMDKEVLKIVGNLIYYRYINSGIVAPDAFDVINIGPGEQLTSRQRRNLATISKTLQAAATKRGFGSDTPHLCSLNPQLVNWHDQFRNFFSTCCRVPCPEAVFAVTAYSEAALIHSPQIQMTLQEVHDTHQLILDHLQLLAPSSSDILHDVLNDLPAPDLSELGDPSGKSEVTLSLCNKYSNIPEDVSMGDNTKRDDCDADDTRIQVRMPIITDNSSKDAKLLEKSKQLLVDVLLCYPLLEENIASSDRNDEVLSSRIHAMKTVNWAEVSVTDVVNCSTHVLQEQRYSKLKAGHCTDSLHAIKTRLSHNLRKLENLSITCVKTGYSELLESVGQDVLNQKQYRQKRGQELGRLSVALVQMRQKEEFMREQRDSYLTYLTTCASHLMEHCSKKLRRGGGSSSGTLTYSGKKLREKGVLVAIRDFTQSQYGNVAFVLGRVETDLGSKNKDKKNSKEMRENSSNRSQTLLSSTAGVFSVTVKYRGVVVENMKITIQELLQMQYEGVRVREIAGGAQVNVNLLLHLLNTKFFVKKK